MPWRIEFLVLLIAIGLRHETGGDWESYIDFIIEASSQSFEEAISKGDPAYAALNWITAQADLGPYFVNTVCSAVFTWGLLKFCQAQTRPWLALVVAMPYLVTVVAMGYTRQGAAIGLVMLGLDALSDRRILWFVVYVALAGIFHKSAIIMVPLAALAGTRNRIWTGMWVGLSSLMLYALLLQESVESFKTNYLEAQYESSGAAIRVAMNAVPAAAFLLFRSRFALSQSDRAFWSWMSVGGLIFVLLLELSPSSTAVDRVALYWIPLQLFVLSRLPEAMVPEGTTATPWVAAVVAYSALVLTVWLFFAAHAHKWVPYQFYPWVLLWG